jgi:hypothetical protein
LNDGLLNDGLLNDGLLNDGLLNDGLGLEVGRSDMSVSDDDTKQKDIVQQDNVVRLGTDTLFAIGDELRRMYAADLDSKPSEELERLMQQIERGDEVVPAPVQIGLRRSPNT